MQEQLAATVNMLRSCTAPEAELDDDMLYPGESALSTIGRHMHGPGPALAMYKACLHLLASPQTSFADMGWVQFEASSSHGCMPDMV